MHVKVLNFNTSHNLPAKLQQTYMLASTVISPRCRGLIENLLFPDSKSHNLTLPRKSGSTTQCDFITRMLFKDSY